MLRLKKYKKMKNYKVLLSLGFAFAIQTGVQAGPSKWKEIIIDTAIANACNTFLDEMEGEWSRSPLTCEVEGQDFVFPWSHMRNEERRVAGFPLSPRWYLRDSNLILNDTNASFRVGTIWHYSDTPSVNDRLVDWAGDKDITCRPEHAPHSITFKLDVADNRDPDDHNNQVPMPYFLIAEDVRCTSV